MDPMNPVSEKQLEIQQYIHKFDDDNQDSVVNSIFDTLKDLDQTNKKNLFDFTVEKIKKSQIKDEKNILSKIESKWKKSHKDESAGVKRAREKEPEGNANVSSGSSTQSPDKKKRRVEEESFSEHGEALEEQKTELEQKHQQALEQQKTELEQQKTELEQQKTELEQQKTELEQKHQQALEQQKTELEQQKTELEQRHQQALEQQKTELEQQKTELEQRHQQALEQQKTELEQQKTELEQQKTELEQRHQQALEQQKTELEQRHQQALEQQKTELEQRHQQALEQQKTELEQNHQQALEQQKTELEQQKTELEQQKTELEQRHQQALEQQKTELEQNHQQALEQQKTELEQNHQQALEQQKTELEQNHQQALEQQKETLDQLVELTKRPPNDERWMEILQGVYETKPDIRSEEKISWERVLERHERWEKQPESISRQAMKTRSYLMFRAINDSDIYKRISFLSKCPKPNIENIKQFVSDLKPEINPLLKKAQKDFIRSLMLKIGMIGNGNIQKNFIPEQFLFPSIDQINQFANEISGDPQKIFDHLIISEEKSVRKIGRIIISLNSEELDFASKVVSKIDFDYSNLLNAMELVKSGVTENVDVIALCARHDKPHKLALAIEDSPLENKSILDLIDLKKIPDPISFMEKVISKTLPLILLKPEASMKKFVFEIIKKCHNNDLDKIGDLVELALNEQINKEMNLIRRSTTRTIFVEYCQHRTKIDPLFVIPPVEN